MNKRVEVNLADAEWNGILAISEEMPAVLYFDSLCLCPKDLRTNVGCDLESATQKKISTHESLKDHQDRGRSNEDKTMVLGGSTRR